MTGDPTVALSEAHDIAAPRADARERKHDGLRAIVAGSATDGLPQLIGDLEAAKAAAWARLAAPRAPAPSSGASDRLLTMPRVAERLGITETRPARWAAGASCPSYTSASATCG